MDLYSRAAQIIRGLPQQKGTADQLKAMALKAGAKPVEFEHARFDKKFSGPTTKDDLAQHLEQSMPQVAEKVFTDKEPPVHKMDLLNALEERKRKLLYSDMSSMPPEEFRRTNDEIDALTKQITALKATFPAGTPKYEKYTTSGGDNYREMVLQLKRDFGQGVTVGQYKDALRQALINEVGDQAYTSSYFKSMMDKPFELMPEEIAEKAREKLGLQAGNYSRQLFADIRNDNDIMFGPLEHKNRHWPQRDVLAHIRMKDRTDEYGQKVLHVEELQSDWAQEARQKGFSEVPYHPLIADTGAWLELALKRIGQEAAQGGYDKVIFTPGQEQADRYSLEKQVRSVSWSPDTQYLTAKTIPGGELFNQTVPKDKLPQYVGKELAERLLATEPKMYPGENVAYHSLIGDDLRVGGTGMKTFYDNVVPKTANKLFGKQGARIEPFGHTEQDGSQYHVMNVTPEMKQQYAGAVPAFAQGGEVEERVIPHGHPEREENKARFLEGNHPEVPHVVYHGTAVYSPTWNTPSDQLPRAAFREFSKEKLGSTTRSADSKAGFWFTSSEDRARAAADDAKDKDDDSHNRYVYEAHISLKNPHVLDDVRDYEPRQVAAIARKAQRMGHDGLLFRKGEMGGSDFLVFEPTQIKSANANQGTFDPENPDITKATGGEVEGWNEYAEGGAVTDYEPQRTVKGYKLFRIKRSQPGKLFPLFVNPNKEVPVGQWLEAEEGPQGKKQGKVKSRLGDLAYRPGWHAGDLPIATHIGGKSDNKLKAPDYRPPDQVWAEIEMPDDVDWQSIANSRMQFTKDGEPRVDTAHITDQIPFNGFYRYKTNPNMTGNWLIGGHVKVNRILSDDEVKAINEAAGTADLPRLEPSHAESWDKFAQGGEVEDEGITAYHGSPHDYPAERLVQYGDGRTEYLVGSPNALPDVPEGATSLQEFPLGRMRLDKIGTGEGAQAYGHGLYTAEAEPIARHYRDALTKGAWNMTIDGQPFTQFYQSTDPEKALKAKIALAVREGRDINQAIDWVEQQTYGKLSSRWLLPEEQPALIKDLARLKQFRRESPDIRQNLGHMYEVRINAHPDHFLDWDKPLSEQPQIAAMFNQVGERGKAFKADAARKALMEEATSLDKERSSLMASAKETFLPENLVHEDGYLNLSHAKPTGMQARLHEIDKRHADIAEALDKMPDPRKQYPAWFDPEADAYYLRNTGGGQAVEALQKEFGPVGASQKLAEAGLKGIKYLDASSRGAGEGSRNYVVFDDKLVNVKRKYADGGEV